MVLKQLTGIVLSIFGLSATKPLRRYLGQTTLQTHGGKWVPAIGIAVYVKLIENRDGDSVGLRWDGPRPFLKRVVTGLVVMIGANIVLAPLHKRFGTEQLEADMGELSKGSFRDHLFIAVTAGVTEELLFRGYALERIEELTGNSLLAAGSTLLAFVLAHKGEMWGWKSVLLIAQPATIITALYLRFRDLPAVITIHALNDLIGLVVMSRRDAEA